MINPIAFNNRNCADFCFMYVCMYVCSNFNCTLIVLMFLPRVINEINVELPKVPSNKTPTRLCNRQRHIKSKSMAKLINL